METLSDKIVCTCGSKYINVKNVKEFIRELKKEMHLTYINAMIINELAGKELTNE